MQRICAFSIFTDSLESMKAPNAPHYSSREDLTLQKPCPKPLSKSDV